MKLRRREPDVSAALGAVVDGLRSGLSLRQAVLRTAGTDGSPFAAMAAALASGRPLASSLRDAAARSGDADLRSAMCVLAAHADAGGDPVPAVSALSARLRRQKAARREARALTTQARLGARAMLLLTPGFWVLLITADPAGTMSSLGDAGTRAAVVLGVALQALGGIWIGVIVRRASGVPGGSAFGRLPLVRAWWALVAGRERSTAPVGVAEAAETIAFVCDAGHSPSSALEAVAPLVGGEIGERLRDVAAHVRAGARLSDALTEATADLDDAASRFAGAFDASMTLGVPLAPALRSLADDVRERTAAELSEDVRRASVRVLIPLGLLILPAFVLSCLVPLLAGGLTGITGS